MRVFESVLLCLTLGSTFYVTQSFPTGAGGCGGGGPAVGGPHIDGSRPTQNGTLAEGLTALFINGAEVFPDTPIALTAGEDIAWEIVTNFNPPPGCPEIPLRGVLFRLEAPTGIDLSAAISGTGSLLQPAAVCDAATGNVVGITHTDNSDKESVAGTLRLDENVNGVIFDITVVYTITEFTAVPGTGNVSFFAYNSFTANFSGSTTSAPVAGSVATSAPVAPAATLAPAATSPSAPPVIVIPVPGPPVAPTPAAVPGQPVMRPPTPGFDFELPPATMAPVSPTVSPSPTKSPSSIATEESSASSSVSSSASSSTSESESSSSSKPQKKDKSNGTDVPTSSPTAAPTKGGKKGMRRVLRYLS